MAKAGLKNSRATEINISNARAILSEKKNTKLELYGSTENGFSIYIDDDSMLWVLGKSHGGIRYWKDLGSVANFIRERLGRNYFGVDINNWDGTGNIKFIKERNRLKYNLS